MVVGMIPAPTMCMLVLSLLVFAASPSESSHVVFAYITHKLAFPSLKSLIILFYKLTITTSSNVFQLVRIIVMPLKLINAIIHVASMVNLIRGLSTAVSRVGSWSEHA